MGLFKRIGRKVRKVGQKAIEQASIGARKISKTAKRAQPILAKAGQIAGVVGTITGQPEIVALGEGLGEASAVAGVVGASADKARGGIEKLRKMDTAKEGVSDIMEAGQTAYGAFGRSS